MASLTTMDVIANACMANNEGAVHFAHGDLPQAMACFRGAMEKMISIINNEPVTPGMARPTPFAPLPSTAAISPSAVASFPLSHLKHFQDLPSNQPDDVMQFDSPLVFQEVVGHSQQAQLIFCGVTVFNMAITSHAKSKTDPTCKEKSVHLYDVSIDFFRRANENSAVFAAILAAALNNKMLLHFDEHQYDELERSSSLLDRMMTEASQSPITKYFLQGQEYEGFLLNILLLRRPGVAEAA